VPFYAVRSGIISADFHLTIFSILFKLKNRKIQFTRIFIMSFYFLKAQYEEKLHTFKSSHCGKIGAILLFVLNLEL